MIGPLYTWIDVDARLRELHAAGKWPSGLVGASAYHDGLDLRLREETDRPAVETALAEWFEARYQPGKGIFLDSLPDEERILSIDMMVSEESKSGELSFRPSFEQIASLPPEPAFIDWPLPFPAGSPAIFAFYSFKGGVGRSLHLLAFLKAMSEQAPMFSCLVIDADMEAPGISSLAVASGFGQPAISLADFLALAHADRSPGWRDAIALTAHHLRSQPLRFSTAGKIVEHYFLPAFRGEAQSLYPNVKPEHLIQGPGARWRLAELFAALGRALQAKLVLLDLRAGLSELASPMLFDPRIQRIVITTPSLQSLEGTSMVLRQLRKLAPPPDQEHLIDPMVLFSLVPREMAGSREMESFHEQFLGIYPDAPAPDEVSPPRLRIEETLFAQELLVISSLNDAMNRLEGTDVAKCSKKMVDEWVSVQVSGEEGQAPGLTLTLEHRQALANFAAEVEYAESGKGERFLATRQLRTLAQKFREEPPNVIVMGAKGSGKTYTYLQLVRHKLWTRFVQATLASADNGEWGHVWPLLQPKNLGDTAKHLIRNCQTETMEALRIKGPEWTLTEARDLIEAAIKEGRTEESWWRRRWFAIFAHSLRVQGLAGDADIDLVEALRLVKHRLVVVIDGLEEIFLRIADDPVQQAAVRTLIQDVPGRLRDIPNCPLGLVAFIRADLVRAAIPQNVGQFERLHEPYALRWDREQALKLTVWLCLQAKIPLAAPEGKPAETLSGEEATWVLLPIWGKKLGRDQSKEAKTADWIIAALSDFRGQIQARDLVRLLRNASLASQALPVADRLLPPATIRNAVKKCSEAKIGEIEQENEVLVPIFDKLRRAPERKIPFDVAELGLDRREVLLLEANGVILESEGEYYMPEIFRQGLGFQLKQGKRPRVLSLAKRALSMRTKP